MKRSTRTGIAAVILLLAATGSVIARHPIHAASHTHKPVVAKKKAPQFLHVTTANTGNLLVAKEGIALTHESGHVMAVGGYTGVYSTSSVFEVFPSVKQTATLPQPTHDAAAGYIDGKLYVFGGGQATSYPYIVRVSGTSSANVENMARPLSDAVAVPYSFKGHQGQVVVGGYDGSVFNTVARFYEAVPSGQLISRPLFTLKVGVRYAGVIAVGEDIYVAGGLTSSGALSNGIYRYSPAKGLVLIGHLAHPLQKAALFSWGGNLVIAGGYDASGEAQNTIWDMNLATGKLRKIGTLPISLADMGYTQMGNHGFLVGGTGASAMNAHIYELTFK